MDVTSCLLVSLLNECDVSFHQPFLQQFSPAAASLVICLLRRFLFPPIFSRLPSLRSLFCNSFVNSSFENQRPPRAELSGPTMWEQICGCAITISIKIHLRHQENPPRQHPLAERREEWPWRLPRLPFSLSRVEVSSGAVFSRLAFPPMPGGVAHLRSTLRPDAPKASPGWRPSAASHHTSAPENSLKESLFETANRRVHETSTLMRVFEK